MAFFRNVGYDLNEKAGDNDVEEEAYGSGGNGDEDASSSEDIKLEDQYRSESENLNTGKLLENEASEVNGVGRGGRRTALVGKWGSSFWKDCQPMWSSGNIESDSSKSERLSEGKCEEYDAQKAGHLAPGSHVDNPADEMLSDEYYEQDGEEQSDYLQYGEDRRMTTSQATLPTPKMSSATLSRHSKSANYNEYNYDDDYEDEDEEEGNNPMIFPGSLMKMTIFNFYHFL